MRKEYVKPVMESEEFVVNEYVAVCTESWTISQCATASGNCSINSEPTTVYSVADLASFTPQLFTDSDCTTDFESTNGYNNQTLYHIHQNGQSKYATSISYRTRSQNAS